MAEITNGDAVGALSRLRQLLAELAVTTDSREVLAAAIDGLQRAAELAGADAADSVAEALVSAGLAVTAERHGLAAMVSVAAGITDGIRAAARTTTTDGAA